MSSLETNNWEIFKTFVNSYSNSSTITRKDLMQYMHQNSSATDSTVDVYRRNITKLGIILWVGNGEYNKITNIPSFLTSNMALSYSVGNNITRYNRMIKLKEIFNEI